MLIPVDKEYFCELLFYYFSYVVVADVYVFGPFLVTGLLAMNIEP